MSRNYWVDLFTGKIWQEFIKNGGGISGFRESRKSLASTVHPGDYFICYLTGLSRLIGVIEVLSESYIDKTQIWQNDVFPVRFKVRVLYSLDPKNSIPIINLKDRLPMMINSEKPNS